MNGKETVEMLKNLAGYSLVFTKHSELRLFQRQIDRALVESHIRKPESLKLAEKLPAGKYEEKYKLWFVPYKRTAYVYVIVINHLQEKIFVKTVIKQRLEWQKKAEHHVK